MAGASLAMIGQCTAFVMALLAVLKGNQYLQLRIKDGLNRLEYNKRYSELVCPP